MTIAAFVGYDEIWQEFETGWAKILDGHSPKAAYVHMKELVRLIKGFDWKLGWTATKAFELVGKCLVYMSRVDKKRFRMFYCSIDLNAWSKLKMEGYPLPDPIEMCNEFCLKGILGWYVEQHPSGVLNLPEDSAHYFFDRDEVFEEPFRDQWNIGKSKFESVGEKSLWILIDEVSSADMKTVPGIQAADMLAWSVNREHTAAKELPGRYLEIMRKVIPAGAIVWDEKTMMRKYAKP